MPLLFSEVPPMMCKFARYSLVQFLPTKALYMILETPLTLQLVGEALGRPAYSYVSLDGHGEVWLRAQDEMEGGKFAPACFIAKSPPSKEAHKEAEAKQLVLLADENLLERAVRGAVSRVCGDGPHWVAVSDTFNIGCTWAMALCKRFGLEPQAQVKGARCLTCNP